MSYPLDRTGRIVARAKHRERIMADAEAEASRYGTSIRCGHYGIHALDGCTDDGTDCLCACHDPEAS